MENSRRLNAHVKRRHLRAIKCRTTSQVSKFRSFTPVLFERHRRKHRVLQTQLKATRFIKNVKASSVLEECCESRMHSYSWRNFVCRQTRSKYCTSAEFQCKELVCTKQKCVFNKPVPTTSFKEACYLL